ncbi:MAG: 5-methylthioadenosine/S-adenosylhomocysteine nucleosidase [Gemmataceae bacterium]|nr:5-methylthioadenosine/S-adenosylhomocysteine nucleosidase [Gemmataceae bacterium]
MPSQFIHGRALVIGVANYPLVSTLPGNVVDDARDVAALLQSPDLCGYPPENVEILLDAQATADNIRAGFGRLAKAAGTDDTVVVFFSGHGGRVETGPDANAYLLPFDCDPQRLRDTAISAADMTELLSAISAGRLVVLLDACHSAGVGEVKALDPAANLKANLDQKTYDALARGTGRVIMASCRSTEVSWVLGGMRNSLFTHYLLEALRGSGHNSGDGLVKVFDVFTYVADKVPARATQQPIFKAHEVENNFPLALDRGGKGVTAAALTPGLAPRPTSLSGKTRLEIQDGLVTRWERVAMYFDVPLPDRYAFERASSPAGRLLDWLEERKKLHALRDALHYLGVDDLVEVIDRNPR